MRGRAIGRAGTAAVLVAVGVTASGCGGGQQDAGEPKGDFRVRVTEASFPATQAIAQPARLRIAVRNADSRTVPDVAVTVETRPARSGSAPVAFGAADSDARLADTEKPVWIVDAGPGGGTTAATNTWALGPLRAGEAKTFEWRLTAVKPGTYTVVYRVSPGLYGRARAASGERTRGSFEVTIGDKPVPARVDDDGNVVRGEQAGAGPQQ
jgi:hypothetical protein